MLVFRTLLISLRLLIALRLLMHQSLEACVMMYAQDMFTTASFPYKELDKALAAS